MLLFQTALALPQFVLGVLVQHELGLLGAMLLTAFVVGVRARHSGLAVTTAVVFVIVMAQV